jgi:hypothetical protein
MTFDSPPSSAPPAADDESNPSDATDNSPEEQDETASLPIDFCPGMTPKEGDTFKVKVVSVDADNGSMDVVYVPGKAPGAIQTAATTFDQGE